MDDMATALADRLNRLLDRIEKLPFDEPEKTDGPACRGTGLDFITDSQTGFPLTSGLSRDPQVRARFAPHIALCDVCGFRAECLERAERIGIWGGTFPHER